MADAVESIRLSPAEDAALDRAWARLDAARRPPVAESAGAGLVDTVVTVHGRHGTFQRHQKKRAGDDAPTNPPTNPPTKAPGAGRRAYDRLKGVGSKALQTRLGRAAIKLEHALSIVAHKTRDVAKAAAERRGLPPDRVAKLARTLAVADFVGSYAVGAGVGAVAGPLAAKPAMFLPNVSALYVAYSTARNPAATWAAARQVVRDTLGGGSVHESMPADLADTLADLFAGDDHDWRQAVFLAALCGTGDAAKAAEAARDAGPEPAELPAATAADFGRDDALTEEAAGAWVGEALVQEAAARAGAGRKDGEVWQTGKFWYTLKGGRTVRAKPPAGAGPPAA